MKTTLQLLIMILFWTIIVQSCKSTHTTTERSQFVSDTLSRIETEIIQIPVKNVTIIESPCKDSVLQPINQVLKVGNTSIKLSEEDGNLVAEIEQKGDTIKYTDTFESHTDIRSEKIDKLEIRYKLFPWVWWLIGIVVAYIAYRILRVYIPIIRFLPY